MAKQFTLHSAEAYSVPFQTSEAVVWRCSVEKVFLEISQNSHKKTFTRVSFLSKVTGQRPATLLKKRLWHRSFPVNFAKFLRALFFYRTPPVAASETTKQGVCLLGGNYFHKKLHLRCLKRF